MAMMITDTQSRTRAGVRPETRAGLTRAPGRARRLAVAVAVVGATVGVAACGGGEAASHEAAPRDPVTAQTRAVTRQPRATTVEAGGLVQARTSAVVTSRLMAPVRDVRVAPGDTVRAGQVLVVLDDRDLGAQARSARSSALAAQQSVAAAAADRQSAEAALTLARASHTRIANLQSRKSATSQELDEATANLRAAEARVAAVDARSQQASATLASAQAGSDAAAVTAGFAQVTAPFAGVVTEKLVEPGNMAMPGTPLLRLEERGGLRLDVRVDAARVGGVAVGQTVDVVLDGPEAISLQGRVSEVARAMDSDARAYLVKIALPDDERLRSGMFGRARFAGPSVAALAVPASAVVRSGQITSVFVAERNVARVRMVVLGQTFGGATGDIEVVSGLADGEQVVLTPPAGLSDGTPLRTGAQ